MLNVLLDVGWTLFQVGLGLLGALYLYRVYRSAQLSAHRPEPQPSVTQERALPGQPSQPLAAPNLRELGWKEK